MTRLAFLENVLRNEEYNIDHIHLYSNQSTGVWSAYGKSAKNLQTLIPQIMEKHLEEFFSDVGVILVRTDISINEMEHYELPFYCILLGDNYIELSMERQE